MTKNEKYIVDMYVRYFGQAASEDTIAKYATEKKASKILKNIRDDADAEKVGLSTEDFVNNAFQNLFGRDATTKQMNKYSKVIEKGKNLPIQSIVKSAAKADKAVYENKKAVALKYAELGGKDDLDLSKISKGNTVDLKTVVTLTDLTNAIEDLADNSGIPSSFDGKTFVLTEGVDTFKGTNKGDLFTADNSTGVSKISAADTLDGGKGVDTFKIYDDTTAAVAATTVTAGSLPTLKNIENVALYNLYVGDLDLKKWDTVETLYVVNAAATAGGAAKGFEVGKKVTTVNFEDIAVNQVVTFDKDLTAATVGVNNVITNVPGAVTVKVDGTALKTLTINAYGKASNVNLTQAAIETLNITGRADLTLDPTSTLNLVKTVDGSKAQGNLTLSKLATMTSVKTGSGNDTVTVAAAASGDTIDLGAGNDKLVKGAGKIAAGSIIDGGAGIDSLDAGLVDAVNAGVFANFEILSLTTVADLDLALVNKSTFTTIAIDGTTTSAVRNVSTSQSLTVNATAGAASKTTLVFKDATGTADAYTINFNADNAANTDAGTVVIDKIETVTVNSVGKTAVTNNTIKLADKDAKSLVITGDKGLTVDFDAAGFGTVSANATDGLGVSTIDASASTAGITLGASISNLKTAWSGLTIKGGAGKDTIDVSTLTLPAASADSKIIVNAGAGDDTITVGAKGGILTGGAGKDTFDVALATATGATEAAAVLTTITDLTAGDKIGFTATVSAFGNTKIALDSTVTNLDLALALASNNAVQGLTWFQYDNNTYIVENVDGTTGIDAGDLVVKINGLVDLTNSTLSGTDLTIA